MKDLKQELVAMMQELDIIQKEPCSKEENEVFNELRNKKENLPEDVYEDNEFSGDSYYRLVKIDLTSEELKNLMMFRQTLYLKAIKNSMTFFVVLVIISMVASFILMCAH